MTKQEFKEKVKTFKENHVEDIAYFKGVTATLIGCMIAKRVLYGKGGKLYAIKDKGMQNLFEDIAKLDGPINVYQGKSTAPIKIKDMGELGNDILKYCDDAEDELTHFFMVGKRTN